MNAYLVLFTISGLLLFWLYKITDLTIIRFARRYRQLSSKRGKTIQGKVIQAVRKKKKRRLGEVPTYIKVEFPNLAGSLITEEFRFIDQKPLRNRYEVGKTVRLLLRGENTSSLQAIPEQAQVKPNSFLLGIYCAILLGMGIAIFYLYHFLWQQAGGEWNRFVSQFSDLALAIMSLSYGLSLAILYFLFKVLGLAFVDKKSLNYIKYHGVRTMATVTSFESTGNLINNNPQVRFHFTFKDQKGQQHAGADKKIVNLLKIGDLPNQKNLEIIYLPNDPTTSQVFEKVANSNSFNMLVLLFYALFFTFSCVILGFFLGSTLL